MSFASAATRIISDPPRHVAVIMDGNGRWAEARGLPRFAGHQRGAQVVRQIVETSPGLGIEYLTLFAFSSENWKRPKDEISDLMSLLRLYVTKELEELNENNVRIRIIGDRLGFSDDIQSMLEDAEVLTATNNGLQLSLALNYGSRSEILKAVQGFALDAVRGKVDPHTIDDLAFQNYLYTNDLPDPDLLIRTSGEQRLSNFLLWQLAYTELIFIDVLWPDFDKHQLTDAVNQFQRRERRYGAASA